MLVFLNAKKTGDKGLFSLQSDYKTSWFTSLHHYHLENWSELIAPTTEKCRFIFDYEVQSIDVNIYSWKKLLRLIQWR